MCDALRTEARIECTGRGCLHTFPQNGVDFYKYSYFVEDELQSWTTKSPPIPFNPIKEEDLPWMISLSIQIMECQ